jgi:hypothetical protein
MKILPLIIFHIYSFYVKIERIYFTKDNPAFESRKNYVHHTDSGKEVPLQGVRFCR